LWGLTRHIWGEVHAWLSLGLLVILFLHLALHWSWVVLAITQRLGLTRDPQAKHLKSGILTTLVLFGLLGAFAWLAQISVKERKDACCPPKQQRQAPVSTSHPAQPTPITAITRPVQPMPTTTITRPVQPMPTTAITRPAQQRADVAPLMQRTTPAASVDFWKDVYPRLASACLRCHGPNKERGGFRIDRREDYFGSHGNTALVVPRNSAQSPLLRIVRGERPTMLAAKAHKLPPRDIAVLQAWIDAGAVWPQRTDQGDRR
jgi:hypothetical protein